MFQGEPPEVQGQAGLRYAGHTSDVTEFTPSTSSITAWNQGTGDSSSPNTSASVAPTAMPRWICSHPIDPRAGTQCPGARRAVTARTRRPTRLAERQAYILSVLWVIGPMTMVDDHCAS